MIENFLVELKNKQIYILNYETRYSEPISSFSKEKRISVTKEILKYINDNMFISQNMIKSMKTIDFDIEFRDNNEELLKKYYRSE